MKKLLFFAPLFFCLLSHAQVVTKDGVVVDTSGKYVYATGLSTGGDSLVISKNGVRTASRITPVSRDSTTYDSRDFSDSGTATDPLRVRFRDTTYLHGKLISTIGKNAAKDSIIVTLNDGTRYAVKDSTGGGGAGGGQVDSAYFWRLGGNAPSYANSILGTLIPRSLRFYTGNAQRMAIDSVGSVGINQAPNTAYKLSMFGKYLQRSDDASGSIQVRLQSYFNADIFTIDDAGIVNAPAYRILGSPSFNRFEADFFGLNQNVLSDGSFEVQSATSTKPKIGYFKANNGIPSMTFWNTTFPQASINKTTGDSCTFQVAGSLSLGYTAVSSTTNMTNVDAVHTLDCTTGTFTVTLPTALRCTGRIIVIKNSGTGAITVAATGSQTIDGLATYPLNLQYKYVHVQSSGANWIVIANN